MESRCSSDGNHTDARPLSASLRDGDRRDWSQHDQPAGLFWRQLHAWSAWRHYQFYEYRTPCPSHHSKPLDLNRFIRGYVGGKLFGTKVREQQREFIPGGGSEPPGPGVNAAGLALYQYETRCGTMYGHSGNTFGFTQYAAVTSDGRRSMTISINLQRTHENEGQAEEVFKAFRKAALLAVCAALAG